jgi:prepilin-type N-terminal cleavage/methylation domain-containing protein
MKSGFTLVELSIVLVIIGLIIGGIVVGRDLINAASILAQVSQIEKYNTAVNTFRGKYGYLPGDIPEPVATQNGFAARGSGPGEGDGNGLLQGINAVSAPDGGFQGAGETAMFWSDLTYANGMMVNLIQGDFSSPKPDLSPPTAVIGTNLAQYIPAAKLGGGNYIVVYSGNGFMADTANFYSLATPTQINGADNNAGIMPATSQVSVIQAYDIDKKIDDGLPQSGRVIAKYDGGSGGNITWAAPFFSAGPPYTTPTAGSATTCFDNQSVNGAHQNYSTEYNGGSGLNCGLSFKLQ